MKRPAIAFGFPLLAKELTELAARRRTYIVRVIYALGLFLSAMFMFSGTLLNASQNSFAMLGSGANLFSMTVALQFFGIYLFLPAMMCTTITAEKERDSFALLMLTRLGPWTILLEKLASRLIPMFTFLLLALPLMAFAYSYGGVQSQDIWFAIWILGLTALQVAALGLMCSAYCRTTVGAFLATNLLGAALFFVLPMIVLYMWFYNTPVRSELIVFSHVGPILFFEKEQIFGPSMTAIQMAVSSLPILLTTLLFLGVARFCIVRRAFAQPRNLLKKAFKLLDSLFWKINENRVTRGVVLVKESSTLPEEAPVAWREKSKKNLSQFRYLIRVFLVFEIPIVAVILIAIGGGGNGYQVQLTPLSLVLFLMWGLSALIISVQAASLVTSERSRQTLDVLLTTPLSSREIVLQKMQGLNRLLIILVICFLSIFLAETWYYRGIGQVDSPSQVSWNMRFMVNFSNLRYFIGSLLSILIYLPLIAWLSMGIGLRAKTQTRAILGSLTILFVWCLVPYLVLSVLNGVFYGGSMGSFLLATSPVSMLFWNEFNDFGQSYSGEVYGHEYRWAMVIVNYAFYGLLLYLLRRSCLTHAGRWMGRCEDQTAVETQPAVSGKTLPAPT